MGKTVLITGGSRGIGAATVKKFVKEGYKTAFLYKSRDEEAMALQKETGALALKADVGNREEVKAAIKSGRTFLGIKGFDTVVCNAGISRSGLFTDMEDSVLDELVDVNLKGAVNVLQETLPYLISEKKGSVVLISSVWGETGASCESGYSLTKSAIIGLGKSLAKELGPSNIRVNTVAPGVINTEMNNCYDEATMKELAEEVPLERIGEPEEVAEVIYFLCSEGASYVTGQVIGVNGGFYI